MRRVRIAIAIAIAVANVPLAAGAIASQPPRVLAPAATAPTDAIVVRATHLAPQTRYRLLLSAGGSCQSVSLLVRSGPTGAIRRAVLPPGGRWCEGSAYRGTIQTRLRQNVASFRVAIWPSAVPAAATLAVRVEQPDACLPECKSDPAAGLLVTAVRVDGSARASTRTDAAGIAGLRVEPGRYRVYVGADPERTVGQLVTVPANGGAVVVVTVASQHPDSATGALPAATPR